MLQNFLNRNTHRFCLWNLETALFACLVNFSVSIWNRFSVFMICLDIDKVEISTYRLTKRSRSCELCLHISMVLHKSIFSKAYKDLFSSRKWNLIGSLGSFFLDMSLLEWKVYLNRCLRMSKPVSDALPTDVKIWSIVKFGVTFFKLSLQEKCKVAKKSITLSPSQINI